MAAAGAGGVHAVGEQHHVEVGGRVDPQRRAREAGVPEGPEIGRVWREVEEWWIDADFTDDEFSIIERLKAVVQATIY